jgi:hypothetical protein
MNHLLRLLLAMLIAQASLIGMQAATFYVATNGNNGNAGSQGSPWLTIQRSITNRAPGDIVRVQAGTYSERISITNAGTSGAWINWVCDGTAICRGFDMNAAHYVRLIGFEITHTNTAFDYGITYNSGSSYVELIDGYIHNIKGGASHVDLSGNNHLTMRGNTVFYTDCIIGVWTNASAYGFVTDQSGGNFLMEYNTIQRCGDVFLGTFGTNCIARNNYCWDFRNIYWNADTSLHSDVFQDGSDGQQLNGRNHIYERNFCGDMTEINSHFGIWQDVDSHGDTNSVIRGNVVYNFGSGGVGIRAESDKVSAFNNTFYNMANLGTGPSAGTVFVAYKSGSDVRNPIDPLCANTLIHTDTANISPGSIDNESSSGKVVCNLGYLTWPNASYVSTNDPLFINPSSHDFHLQSASPARAKATNLVWITSLAGSGTSFTVNDPFLFFDGWGMVDGDIISVGGSLTMVTNINWTTKTFIVNSAVTWTNLMPVYWGSDTAPDVGAFPYGSSNLTSAAIYVGGNVYTVTTAGNARGVWFYVDGIPTTWVANPPYEATIASGSVTAKAYALYAQATPFVVASPAVAYKTVVSGKFSASGPLLLR